MLPQMIEWKKTAFAKKKCIYQLGNGIYTKSLKITLHLGDGGKSRIA